MFEFVSKKSVIERAKFALIFRLLKKQFKLRVANRLLSNKVKRADAVKRRELAVKDTEIERLNKLVDTQARRFEIEIMETRDRFAERAGSYGSRFAQTREEDEVIKLKAQKYEQPKPKTGRDSLSGDEQLAYDERFSNHLKFCEMDGRSHAEAVELWKLHEGDEIQQIGVEFGGYQEHL